jgi:uncharacterized membrane protein YgdD (TMEM256/DUF423 family)
MERKTLALASSLLLIAVAFGAFGAHGLKARLTPEALSQWHTGVVYQFMHALGILFLAVARGVVGDRALHRTRTLFLAGIICFSGSLYLLSTKELMGMQAFTFLLGPLTPIGGLLFVAGWTVLLITALRGDDVR